MQAAPPPTSGAAPPTAGPAASDGAERVADPSTAAGAPDTSHAMSHFRRYAVAWVPVVVLVMLIEAATVNDGVTLVTLFGLTAGAGAAVLVAAYALSRPQPGRWPILAAAVIDVAALAIAFLSSSGNDTAIMLPFLGALLLVGILDGWALRVALAIQWSIGMVGALIAYALGPLRAMPDADPLAVSLATAAATTFVGYSFLWWVRDRLNGATAAARLAEAEARTSAAAVEALIRGTPVPTIAFDPSGTIRTWNPAADAAFGWHAEEMLGGTLALLAPGGEPDGDPSAVVARVLAGETIEGIRATWQARDGRVVVVQLHAALLVDADGSPDGAVLQAIDDTERETLRARVSEVQRLESVGQLAGGVAHDFNNLLTAVSGYAQLLADSLPPDSPARADAVEIERAAGRGANLVSQLLAFGRRQAMSPVPLDLNGLVEGLRPMLDRLIGTHARINVQTDRTAPPVLADPGQLEQIVVNLAVNARDATPAGGDITIRVSTLHGRDGKPEARLSVVDTGTGMDQATQTRIFEPFFTTKAPGRGTGLGLSTVYGIVSAHGGKISVVSAPGRGTAFHVDLPTAPDPSVQAADFPAPRIIAQRAESGTVLVIDDEEAVRRLVVRALQASGYRVLEAGDLWGAIQVAHREEGPIDLVLTDVVMPDCRGPELAGRIRGFHPEARVLYMTGFAADGLGGPEATDVDGPVLAKPFTIVDLARRVADTMADRHPPR